MDTRKFNARIKLLFFNLLVNDDDEYDDDGNDGDIVRVSTSSLFSEAPSNNKPLIGTSMD